MTAEELRKHPTYCIFNVFSDVSAVVWLQISSGQNNTTRCRRPRAKTTTNCDSKPEFSIYGRTVPLMLCYAAALLICLLQSLQVMSHFINRLACDLPENVASSDRLCAALPTATIGLKYALQVSQFPVLILQLPTAATNMLITSPHIGSAGIRVLGKCQ